MGGSLQTRPPPPFHQCRSFDFICGPTRVMTGAHLSNNTHTHRITTVHHHPAPRAMVAYEHGAVAITGCAMSAARLLAPCSRHISEQVS